MLRVIVAIMAVVALTLSAAAYDTVWDGSPSGDITIDLMLNCYVQIEWQDVDIVFDDNADWYCAQLEGLGYSACPDPDGKGPLNPWAGGGYYTSNMGMYYESFDGAVIFFRSNNPLSMDVTVNGDLHAVDPDCGDCYIPTWLTMCAAPLMVEDVWTGVGTIPNDGWGTYLHLDSPGVLGYNDPVYGVYPMQQAIPCEPPATHYVLGPLCPGVEGTMKFLARIHRNGMLDAGGDYSTVVNVLFTSP